MSFLSGLVGGGVAEPITAIGNVLDKLFTSDDERLGKKALLEKLAQKPAMAQVELNKIEASHRSIFIAGWRPFIGWVCGMGLAYDIIVAPIANGFGGTFPAIDAAALHSLIIALLGLGGLRTWEKFRNKTK